MQDPAPSSPAFLPVSRLSAEIAAGRLSPVEIVEDCLARTERLEPKLQAYVSVDWVGARAAAEAAGRAVRAGYRIGPLHGIPIAVKDLVEIEGKVTQGGSAAWKGRVAPRTATLVRKLVRAGMIVLGKTHTVEFAYGAWGTNERLGTPWNPWDAAVRRAPGGSSSGSAVAVAARVAPWAIGTDTGGSVRIPAAWNGVTGLKTTIGRISVHGVLPLSPTLDTPGPITRSVEDAATLLYALQGPDPKDLRTLGHPPSEPWTHLRRGVAGLRLAQLPAAERTGVDAEILAAYDRSVGVLASLGAEIVDLELPGLLADLAVANGRIISAEAYALLADLVDDAAQPLDEAVRPRVRAGAAISSRAYLADLAERERLKGVVAGAMEGIDAILTPTMETPAPPISDIDQAKSPTRFTRWVNFLDLCALAIPNGFTEAGLPTSLQVVCRSYDEAMALRIGWACEAATEWRERVPPMAV
jgi:aspartyl-tRNA(Asn)/glutamyl-tRNA(Gln) amidotransferase subunit A